MHNLLVDNKAHDLKLVNDTFIGMLLVCTEDDTNGHKGLQIACLEEFARRLFLKLEEVVNLSNNLTS